MNKLPPSKPLSAEAVKWLEENKDAIAAYNERIAKHGMLIMPEWLRSSVNTKSES